MKTPKLDLIISIKRNRKGFYWTVSTSNSKKVGTTGETHVRKSQAVRMAKRLFLAGFREEGDAGMFVIATLNTNGQWTEKFRLLEDLTTKPKKKK